jgi:acetylornithine deacetylase
VIQAVQAPHLNIPDDLTRATAQVTVIAGGTQSNVIPDACRLTVDCRTTPEFDNEAMLAHLEACARVGGGTFTLHSARFKPCQTATDEPLVRAALQATGSAKATVFPSVCDLFWVSHVPSLVMGPGRPERSHQADEFVLAEEVVAGVQTYAKIAELWWKSLH